jgi:hypothetical protein
VAFKTPEAAIVTFNIRRRYGRSEVGWYNPKMLRATSKLSKPTRLPATKKKALQSVTLSKAQAKAKERHDRLLRSVKNNRPPQEWFDQNDCPFTPTKS